MDEQEKSAVQDLLDVDLDAIVADENYKEKHKKKRKPLKIIISAVILFILAVMVLPNLTSSSEPIVGKWNAYTVMGKSGKATPIVDRDNNYVNIKKNGTFTLHLDSILEATGTWKRYEKYDDSKTGMVYVLDFENGIGGFLFYKGDIIYITIVDIGISFQK